jgi:hypothetical protein
MPGLALCGVGVLLCVDEEAWSLGEEGLES